MTESLARKTELDRVYALMTDVGFQETVLKWLKEVKESATVEMAMEDDLAKMNKAKGRYLAAIEILDRLELVTLKREAKNRNNKDKNDYLTKGTTK